MFYRCVQDGVATGRAERGGTSRVAGKTDSLVGLAGDVSSAAQGEASRPRRRVGLSGQLFLVTVAFVVAAEILTYVPAVANYRIEWMEDRLAAAQVAALVLDGRTAEPVSEDLESRLLTGVNARAIAVRDGGAQRLLAAEPIPDRVSDTVDLGAVTIWTSLRGAWRTLTSPVNEPIRVVGPGKAGFARVEILLDEAPLRTAMIDYAWRLAVSSLIIAAVTAGLVFVVLQFLIVRPVRRLATNITAFADAPKMRRGSSPPRAGRTRSARRSGRSSGCSGASPTSCARRSASRSSVSR